MLRIILASSVAAHIVIAAIVDVFSKNNVIDGLAERNKVGPKESNLFRKSYS